MLVLLVLVAMALVIYGNLRITQAMRMLTKPPTSVHPRRF